MSPWLRTRQELSGKCDVSDWYTLSPCYGKLVESETLEGGEKSSRGFDRYTQVGHRLRASSRQGNAAPGRERITSRMKESADDDMVCSIGSHDAKVQPYIPTRLQLSFSGKGAQASTARGDSQHGRPKSASGRPAAPSLADALPLDGFIGTTGSTQGGTAARLQPQGPTSRRR